MTTGFARLAIAALLLLFGAWVAEPYVSGLLSRSAEPRTVVPRGDLAGGERSVVELFERAAPSVVQVIGVPRGARRPSEGGTNVSSGSGFVWDSAGHVVTNNHVVENAGALGVRLVSGETVEASLVGRAPNYDLAVLRLERASGLPAPLAIGSSADLKVGQSTFAIGNPFGLDQSLTTGVVSALRRRLPTAGGREIADVIQTDAAINPGNSGGPLLDSAGRLIGVNTAIFSPSGTNAGIGFAIPVDIVNRIVPELIRNGRVPTPGIGILIADEALAGRLGVDGVIVGDTLPNSPAARAGIQGLDMGAGRLGDVITEANGRPVRRLSDLTQQLEAVGVGRSIRLVLTRGRTRVPVEVEVVDVSRS